MRYANDEVGQKVEATSKGQKAICPLHGCELVSKFGSIIKPHWSHKAGTDCDAWGEPEGDWHLGWKELVVPDAQEVTIADERGTHRADIVGNKGLVVELQHSPISPETIQEREDFYGNMIWVFDLTELPDDRFRLRNVQEGMTRLSYYGGLSEARRLGIEEIRRPRQVGINSAAYLRHHREAGFTWTRPKKSLTTCKKPVFLHTSEDTLIEVVDWARGLGRLVTLVDFCRRFLSAVLTPQATDTVNQEKAKRLESLQDLRWLRTAKRLKEADDARVAQERRKARILELRKQRETEGYFRERAEVVPLEEFSSFISKLDAFWKKHPHLPEGTIGWDTLKTACKTALDDLEDFPPERLRKLLDDAYRKKGKAVVESVPLPPTGLYPKPDPEYLSVKTFSDGLGIQGPYCKDLITQIRDGGSGKALGLRWSPQHKMWVTTNQGVFQKVRGLVDDCNLDLYGEKMNWALLKGLKPLGRLLVFQEPHLRDCLGATSRYPSRYPEGIGPFRDEWIPTWGQMKARSKR